MPTQMEAIRIFISHFRDVKLPQANNISADNLVPYFWTMCQHVYNLYPEDSSSLRRIKLSEVLNQIMTKWTSYKEEKWAQILLIVLRMLKHRGLLDAVQFNVTQFYDVTALTCQPYFKN
ncbi:hypothetical protein RF11_09566 [Thelohanellus kitauei]|uniref:Uncharacterized protein n=1 Tax=Thelohanellus kitauei TaxID=669202 RepID=A0A0C2JB85_THEKT|nr:hypothetical protein RF11_09566 [Thelohanellus kitauei]